MNKDDLNLFLRFRNGDESALKEVCKLYAMHLTLWADRILLNKEKARAAVVEVIKILWTEPDKLDDPAPEDTLEGYLSKKVTSYCKGQSGKLYIVGERPVFMHSVNGTATLGYHEHFQALYAIVEAQLPDQMAKMFKLFFIEQKSLSAIAIELGLKPWNAKLILRETVRRVRLLF